MDYRDIITFWFKDTRPQQWFVKDEKFDKKIAKRFLALHSQVSKGEKESWRKSTKGRLAEIIVLDQFSRNLFRGKPESFAYDNMALALAQEAIRTGAEKKLSQIERRFLYMPYMHSESKIIHIQAMRLFGSLTDKDSQTYEIAHKKIIEKFGRYPHRNSILGRVSTPEELEFISTNEGF
jgi:uncharacterized protein (DUF924 family)